MNKYINALFWQFFYVSCTDHDMEAAASTHQITIITIIIAVKLWMYGCGGIFAKVFLTKTVGSEENHDLKIVTAAIHLFEFTSVYSAYSGTCTCKMHSTSIDKIEMRDKRIVGLSNIPPLAHIWPKWHDNCNIIKLNCNHFSFDFDFYLFSLILLCFSSPFILHCSVFIFFVSEECQKQLDSPIL